MPIWNVPYRRNPYFTGQESILGHLHDTLDVAKTAALTQPHAISGLGGIGKTQIALEYAYRHRNEYHAILWAQAESRESLVLGFTSLANLLRLPEQNAQDQTITIEAVRHWLDTHQRWLLILDNADDLTILDPFLPSSGKGHILLTTRAQAQGTIAHGINVEEMETAEGILFLLRRTRILDPHALLTQAVAADSALAQDIVQILGGLPLALDQAGAYIEETGCGLRDYLDRYRTQHTILLQRRGTLVKDHPEPVATTWSLSFEKVKQIHAIAAQLLQFCAFLHPDTIPEELLTEVLPDLDTNMPVNDLFTFDEAIQILRAYSLVRRHPETKTLSIHRLVQAVLRDAMHEHEQHHWAERAVRVVNHLFPSGEPDTWSLCERYLLNAQTCAGLIEQWNITNSQAIALLHQAATYLKERAQYTGAQSFTQQALTICEQELKINHLDTAQTLNNLAYLYESQGKYSEAEPLYQRALAFYQQLLGTNHSDTAITLNNLAALYMTQGKQAEAETLYQQALAIREQVLGADHPDTAQTLNNLAALYDRQDKYAEAEPLYQRALAIYEKALGANHPDTATILNNLAYLYDRQDKYAKAEPLYQRALAICEQVLSHHPDTAQTLNNLAELYRVQDKYSEAEPLYQHALAIYEEVLGTNHPDTATTLNNFAALYMAQGKYAEAETLYQRALTIREQVLEVNHLDTAQSLNNLAALYESRGKYAEAKPLYQRALTIYEQTLGTNHITTVTIRGNYIFLQIREKQDRKQQS